MKFISEASLPAHTRRQFLKTAGAATFAATVSHPSSLLAEDAPERKIRLGVVGGNFGAAFFWHQHPNCVVTAVSDLIPARREHLMKTYKCSKSYESLEKLIQDKNIEAVAIFTPAPDHVQHVVATLKAGKHVICAVPAAQTLEDCQLLIDTVKSTGLTYMMAETSHYQQATISVRKMYKEGKFGNLFYTESEYMHPGIENLYFEKGKPTWRHGSPPMLYPTHCTSHLVSVTGERLTEVTCLGWGDDDPAHKNNVYNNPFWNETGLFKTNRGNAMRICNYRKGAVKGAERAYYYGDKMSFYSADPLGRGPMIVHAGNQTEKDDGGFTRQASEAEPYEQEIWWKTDLLPKPLRHESGHGGSHVFLVHEFIEALLQNRKPTVNVYEAVAYTAPGLVAHDSAMKGGERLKIPSFDPA
ncbi:MAG TPA: Gfo/Idh/MocA family oxidoreductase [Verrucomicrobiae bacterium]|nr:Gfo/Idh/MocA family oxidoreductase [Verrucomicrobiae bacterium]